MSKYNVSFCFDGGFRRGIYLSNSTITGYNTLWEEVKVSPNSYIYDCTLRFLTLSDWVPGAAILYIEMISRREESVFEADVSLKMF